MHSLILDEHSDVGLLLSVRMDTVDRVSKLAMLSTRLTGSCPSLCTLGENSLPAAILVMGRGFLVGFKRRGALIGRARGTIKT